MKKKNLFSTGILLAFVALISVHCGGDKKDSVNNPPPQGNDCSNVQAKFTANVLPIIQGRCATNSGCHGSGSTNGPGELITYAQISSKASAINDAAVVNSRMPKTGGALTADQKATLRCWISSGTPNN
ncbi:hypothetical protein LL912_16200 [Niabella sp. CC-SYL272]|uniref:hypothetical protein n=1 Tax=Niabella agricola TaxID=2891571 RepID=UPI001F282585|nr:hypothetical protein [Niabella agricola]MCF3110327.1 hypothetical protein [Niabella agricola]